MAPFTVGPIEVALCPTTKSDICPNSCPFNQSSTVLPAGHKKNPNARSLAAAVIFDHDQPVLLRDGTRIGADVYRPTGENKVPAIMMWGPYGKSGTGTLNLQGFPKRAGIPESKLSGYESFEGLDPAEWVPKGYAIVNVDPRGVFYSEGSLRWWGSAEGRDGCDAVEYIAALPWCSGKVALAGNSWLGIAQWFIAAERPPHLACIAPLEAASDFLRESFCRGGIPATDFTAILAKTLYGHGEQEDVVKMLSLYPFANEYWEDKRAKIENIQVPAYILGSYSTGLHTVGSVRGYQEIPHDKKWFVTHATQEWYDLYTEERTRELQSFFDRYTKEIPNDWEQTPRVRLAFIRFNKPAVTNQPFADLPWRLPGRSQFRLFLTPEYKLSPVPIAKEASISYQADAPSMQTDSDPEELQFIYVVPDDVVIAGPLKAVLFMSSLEHDDIDVYVQLRKADKVGKLLQHSNIPLNDLDASSLSEISNVNVLKYLGPQGMLRASARHVSDELSSGTWQTLSHSGREPVRKGEVVRLEVYVWPTGIVFEAGEWLVLKVSGHNMCLAEFEFLQGAFRNSNQGRHIMHLGGIYESYLEVPICRL